MATANEAFDALLRKRIEEEVRQMSDNAVVGVQTSLDRVNYNNGVVAGMTKCLGLCDEVNTELSKR